MTGSTPGIIIMIVVVMITLVAWIILVFMPMLILGGGAGHRPARAWPGRRLARPPRAGKREPRPRGPRDRAISCGWVGPGSIGRASDRDPCGQGKGRLIAALTAKAAS